MNEVEARLLAAPGQWILALMATQRSLTPVLVHHVLETGDVVESVLMDDVYWWFIDMVNLGVDVNHFVTFIAESVQGHDERALEPLEVFFNRLRSTCRSPADRETAQRVLAHLPPAVAEAAELG